ncbi:DEKNAAC103692 [Brettanomyces naardenensis]|uniref:PAN2-PAN3 deadenylation complex catalytic subunit PAN2 n=1 Tax=Brettanomyces naardenensis TaxID=13370 RepID=A0A448YNW2_BRENA|nr:DEKNAAC103692 [Brettanomyces naardenensis]
MDGWGELLQIPAVKVPRHSRSLGQPTQKNISSLTFDTSHDLIWIGDSSGYLYSFYSLKLQPYVSCRAHKGPITQILSHKKGIVTLSGRAVRLGTIQGVSIYQITCSPEHGGLRCMSYTSNTQTELLVGGKASSTGCRIFKIDLVNGKLVGSIDYAHDLLYMDANLRYVVLGRADGCVDIFDPKSQKVVKTFRCHLASLSSMCVHDNLLLTTGYSLKKDRFVPDPLVNCFDLQSLTSRTPIAFPAGPTHIYLHPRVPNLALVASNMGQIHFVDIYNPTKLQIYQAELTSYITIFDLAASGDCFAFIDGMQSIHLWARIPNQIAPIPSFTVYSTPVDLPTVDRELIPLSNHLSFDSYMPPLNSLKLPHYEEMLLSAWPPEMVFQVGSLPKPIDYEILRSLESIQGFQVARYNKDKFGPRNVVTKYKKRQKLSMPKFISEQDDDDEMSEIEEDDRLMDEHQSGDIFSTTSTTDEVPNAFCLFRIAYSKFGVDDFDFGYYNKTAFSGLEADAGNTYTNSILQLYRFNPPLCNYILKTLAEDVAEDDLILVELGYLFDMMVKANGRHCAASNFQRIFSAIPEAQRLGLVTEDGRPYDAYGQRRLVQTFNRFILEKMSQDEQTLYKSTSSSRMNAITGIPTETAVFSSFCTLSQKRSTFFHSIDVNSLPPPSPTPSNLTILNYIEASMNKKVQHMITCDTCKRQHPIDASLRVEELPPDLILNIDLTDEQLNKVRFLDGWMVPEFYMTVSSTGSPILRTNIVAGSHVGVRKYKLAGYVAQITDRANRSHLVTITETSESSWCLFNDFLVTPIATEEVFNMSYWWKKPVIVVYRAVDTVSTFDYQCYKQGLNDSILYRDHFAKGTREGKAVEYELLTHDEAPQAGTMVAIDAEFVQLVPQEFEISFHKQKRLVKPKKLALGRISVLRCEGEKEGECFIDDYIVASEHIDDYITSFSGIEPGDLDPDKSKRTLVTLQTAYRKMWLLLNLGCIFVGHSLKGDFRMINIQVPLEQVRDTAELYYLKKERRKLSLKYLIYQVFQDNVQTGNHDSIEDAYSALRLYRKYLELVRTGQLESTLQRIYLEGQMSRFRIPQ